MIAPSFLPELARDSQLTTVSTPGFCVHLFAETPFLTRKQVWKRTKLLGSGGFATVWLETCVEGHDSRDGILRAVKVIHLGNDVPAAKAISRYGRELEVLAKFSQRKYSRCFVRSYGWYEDTSCISICLEYLPLGDLHAFLAKRADPTLPEPEVQQISSQVLDALIFMHVEGFAHRDIKPSNILIKSHGPDNWWVKLSDFGLSKRTGESSSNSGLEGTWEFMAPELWGDETDHEITRTAMWYSADLWSLGETAFRLITGRPTFEKRDLLLKYTGGRGEFPASELLNAMASQSMVDFVTGIMLADYKQRPTAKIASTHPWLRQLKQESSFLSL